MISLSTSTPSSVPSATKYFILSADIFHVLYLLTSKLMIHGGQKWPLGVTRTKIVIKINGPNHRTSKFLVFNIVHLSLDACRCIIANPLVSLEYHRYRYLFYPNLDVCVLKCYNHFTLYMYGFPSESVASVHPPSFFSKQISKYERKPASSVYFPGVPPSPELDAPGLVLPLVRVKERP